ncbi:Peptidase C19 ubiquitin carboxyl-terminal hydrolase 2 [Macrophomina phaseolina MS6]|uniref:ubiquitinyl hydrolase 1 n=1 Tax=Macrophomina phaseolina (strain MS6) TaxID=1126212 RepID=K2RVA7_MACPH|nr:Peptidase C19 ubiquitin carboxyl-terminal hydrolase 2 [Macrophomina phaseolina MS6]
MSAVPGGSCRHNLTLKPDQCVLPIEHWDRLPDKQTVYKLASYCRLCRYHVSVVVDFRQGTCTWPCPNEEYKLHHFIHTPATSRRDGTEDDGVKESYRFECSSLQCGAILTVEVAPPRLSAEDVRLLSDKRVLEARLQSAKRIDPERPDLQAARPIEGLYILHAYVRDSLNGKGGSRIPLRNRKFLVTYGEDCDELLLHLGFSKKNAHGEEEAAWLLPCPPEEWDHLQGDSLRDRLDDTMQELMCLIDRMPHSQKQELKKYNYKPSSAREYLERMFGAYHYPKRPGYTANTQGVEDHPYYAGLGALGVFSDSLLAYAYDRQITTDPQNHSYYYECLADLATGRRSEELDMKKAMEESKGIVSRKDALQALRRFNLEPDRFASYTDEYIINQFRARVQNVGSYEVPELRAHLKKIGAYRQSQTIMDAAADVIQTYEQALSWLGADATNGDDQVIALATLKKSEDPNSESKIAEVVKIIADHRNSESLGVWLATGEIKMGSDPDLEKTKAFSAFGLSDHQGGVDPEMLELTLNDLKEREPSKSDEFDRHPLDQWPVGIENLGNTCYLNAILQFLFTIKPLREFVLNIDEHLMDINEENIRKKRVGSRMVTAEEVERSQQFVKELKDLFEQLMTAPSHTIRPRKELVQRALEYAAPNEQPGPSRTDAAEPVSTEQPTSATEGTKDVEMVDGAVDAEAVLSAPTEADSDATLVDDKNSETLPDAGGDTDAENGTSSDKVEKNPPPPEHPPPVPPRNQNSTTSSIPFTMQQDASEILINILLQLSYAIRPDRFRDDGEQLDFIKELFYGEEAVSLNRKGKMTEQTSLFNTQYVTVVDKPKHIYEAIDDTLDMGAIEDSDNVEKWTTILRAPPILKIDVKRLGYDKAKKQTVRSENHLQLEDTIYIDRYLRDEATLQRRKQSWEKKAKLKHLRERRAELAETRVDISMSEAVRAASQFIKDTEFDDPAQAEELAIDETFVEDMAAKAEETRKEISALDDNIATVEAEISSLFADMTSVPYKLHSLFIHRGGTGGGHYLVSIRDFKSGMWRNYNDETISEVTDIEKNIFGQGDTYTKVITTCVVYVRADLKYGDKELVEAVNRNPIQVEAANEDTEMTNFSRDDASSMKFTEGVDPENVPEYSDEGYDTSQMDFTPSGGRW